MIVNMVCITMTNDNTSILQNEVDGFIIKTDNR